MAKHIANVFVMHNEHERMKSVHWEFSGARFHIFVGRDDSSTVLYKNPIVARGDVDFFETRRLDGAKRANAWMIEEVLRVVRDDKLFEIAKAEHDRKQAEIETQWAMIAGRRERAKALFKHIRSMLDAGTPSMLLTHNQLDDLLVYDPGETEN